MGVMASKCERGEDEYGFFSHEMFKYSVIEQEPTEKVFLPWNPWGWFYLFVIYNKNENIPFVVLLAM